MNAQEFNGHVARLRVTLTTPDQREALRTIADELRRLRIKDACLGKFLDEAPTLRREHAEAVEDRARIAADNGVEALQAELQRVRDREGDLILAEVGAVMVASELAGVGPEAIRMTARSKLADAKYQPSGILDALAELYELRSRHVVTASDVRASEVTAQQALAWFTREGWTLAGGQGILAKGEQWCHWDGAGPPTIADAIESAADWHEEPRCGLDILEEMGR